MEDNSVAVDERSTEELDKLADSSETATNRDRAMSVEPDKAEPTAKTKEEAFEFVHSGKPIKATREQIIKWAQQGYDYPQKLQKLNQEKTKWDSDRQKWEQQWGVYKQIDDFAAQNKDWWNYMQQGWQSRTNFNPQAANQALQPGQQGQPDPYASKFHSLEQKLSQFDEFLQQQQQEKILAQEKEQDSKLEQDIQSIRDQYKDLDWQTIDDNGKSLEMRILEHAQENGIPSFRAAARDLLHEELLSKAEAQGKIAVSKGIQARTKLGVLGESPTPMSNRSMPRSKSIKDTSYEEIQTEINEELRLARR